MTWPTVAVTTTNVDAGTDSPATARTDILDALTKQNQMIAHVSSFMAGHLADTTAAAARTTLGAQVAGSYQATLGYTAADDSAVVHKTGAETIAGVKTFTGQPVMPQSITLGTAVATTSGTAIDFTGLPSWAKRITVLFNGVSTSGANGLLLQIGSGSIQTTGYASAAVAVSTVSTNTTGAIAASNGMVLFMAQAAGTFYGSAVFSLMGANQWVQNHTGWGGASGTQVSSGAGNVALSGSLDRVRLTTTTGIDVFDAGSVNILYE